uniref:Inorganic pyrophosphatase n=1 Tax=Meloidogyne hapla TaxID=6305 RepID=A0A1I8BYW8_MELHA
MFRALTKLIDTGNIGNKLSFANMSQYTIAECGSLNSLDYRIFIKGPTGNFVSPWHDIPLFADPDAKIFNMVVEIPRWTNAKMEMATKEPMSPIRQDDKKGLPRFVNNIFPHHGYIWNYGALPQTWEDPNHLDANTGAKGDNDPIDIIEIGSKIQGRGSIVQVKVLGTLALLDEGETDWKLVGIDIKDDLASKLNNINDVELYMPGLLSATQEWFRVYKIPTGKPENKFAFNGEFKDKEFAIKVIEETNMFWKSLIASNETGGLNTECLVPGATFPANQQNWEKLFAKQPKKEDPKPIPESVDKWHYISLSQ